MNEFDVTIIGGGINGTAIARDAAGRGLHVLLLEQSSLASGTSSTSTKLIHGGLRYLEQRAFNMVHEALIERTTLLKMAPHIIWPARFILPHHEQMRPAWQLRVGLFIYDMLASGNILPGACSIKLTKDEAGAPLQDQFKIAFEYSDCSVDDARFVILNAVDAHERGATIFPHSKFEHAVRQDHRWLITYTSRGEAAFATSKMLVNAAGPWVEGVNKTLPDDIPKASVKLVKGSHIVVKKLFNHNKSYIFQNNDGRIVFAIPYHDGHTLIGTTEVQVNGDPAHAIASEQEIMYLCDVANQYFKQDIRRTDVVWSFAGVRPLYDERTLTSKDLSRDFLLTVDGDKNMPPLLCVYGGKLTAARKLAEDAVNRLSPFISMQPAWTTSSHLPGGDFEWNAFDQLVENTKKEWPFLTLAHATRLARAYGTRVAKLLGDTKSMDDLGICFGADLTQREVDYLMNHEWARSAHDILWLHSKLGLQFKDNQTQALKQYMSRRQHG